MKIAKAAQNVALLFPSGKSYALILATKWNRQHFGRFFFTNSSGHPAPLLPSSFPLTRVTRLGELSPSPQWFSLGSFLENYKSSPNFWASFSTIKSMYLS
jgi:hypothetical protein